MPEIKKNTRYDPKDKDSILKFAGELTETTMREWVEPERRKRFRGKGQFGQILERGVFYIETNSESKPDFEEVGIELKSAPIKMKNDGKMVPKERMSLSTINYMTLHDEGWEGSFWNKNHELLVIFYLYDQDKTPCDMKILDSALWNYPENDLMIIRNDWDIIAKKIREGKAHEISESDTMYLAACRKGAGKGKDNRRQPNSAELALQRAFSLKPSYVKSIWEHARYKSSIIKGSELYENSLEREILSRFEIYKGMRSEAIKDLLDPSLNVRSKQYHAMLARSMLGVGSKKIEEFEKADIFMRVIRLQKNGVPKESISFSHFDYMEESNIEWEESEFHELLKYRKFLFVVFQIDDAGTYFKGATFWSMPHSDFKEAERVWRITVERIKEGRMDELPKTSESSVAHVRPHGRNSKDMLPAPNGKEYPKNSFWLNASYVGDQLRDVEF